MFSRSPNQDIARGEGHNVEKPKTAIEEQNAAPYRMKFWWNYIDPSHKHSARPVVDVSAPLNVLDETHQARKFGTQKVAYGHLSLNEFVGTYEEVPYAESHHTSEIVRMWILAWNVWYVNYTLARNLSSSLSPQPRLRGAFYIALMMGWIRINIAATIGAAGYFYTYEYLYTHGPAPFRIRDPSPNGWKLAWQEGQECYLARAVASIFPALGYAFFMGRWKKSAFWFLTTLTAGEYYEYARRNVMSGSRLFYSYQANKELQRQAAWGSLAPDLRHRVDPDTTRSASVSQFRYLRLTSGPLQDTIWNNIPHENLPLHRTGKMVPNPYFNWQKAPQNYNEKPYKVKNDLWQLPQVLDSRMRSGAMD